MKKYVLFVIAALALCSFKVPKPAPDAPHIKWLTWEQAQEAQKKKPKKIFVDIYTSWCGWCKKMDADTYENPVIAKYLSDNFYCIKFDAETRENITFKGEQYGPDGRNNRLATFLLQNRMSYPTIVYLDEDFNLINTVPGYMSAQQIEPILAFHATNSYKTTPWDEFQKKFKSAL